MKNSKTIKEIAEGILVFLKNNNLEESLPDLISYLRDKDDQNIVNIYSAKDLSVKEKLNAQKFVKNLIGDTPKQILFSKDETLIDGLKISYKDKMWDFSIRGQVSKLIRV